jgi:hypothetical protein
MDAEAAIVTSLVALAGLIVAWRVWGTLRVAQGKRDCGGCGCAQPEPAKR